MIVNTLDGKERFAQRVGRDQVMLKFVTKPLAEGNSLRRNVSGRGEVGKEEQK